MYSFSGAGWREEPRWARSRDNRCERSKMDIGPSIHEAVSVLAGKPTDLPEGRALGRGVLTEGRRQGGSDMIIGLAILIVFIIGMITGVVFLVSFASRKEDKRSRLSREAPDRTTLAGRYLTSLYVRRPGDELASPGLLDDQRQAEMFGWPNLGPGDDGRK
jgi:hypothetical protein